MHLARPKCDAFVGFKCPSELKEDALALGAMAHKTEAEIWKEAMEFRLSFLRMIRLGYWNLRIVATVGEDQPDLTMSPKV